MSRVLILYATHHGQTRSIALAIAERLRDRGNVVDLADVREWHRLRPVGDYDAVVLGSRVELGRHASEMLAFIQSQHDALCRVPTAFFSVSMAASNPDAGVDPEQYMLKTFAQLGWHPVLSAAFAGGLPYRRYNWVTRLVMKHVSRKAGHPTDTSRNHELTDWRRVTMFADKVAYIAGAAPTVEAPQLQMN